MKNLDLRLAEIEENRDFVPTSYIRDSKYKRTKQSSCESHRLDEFEAHECDGLDHSPDNPSITTLNCQEEFQMIKDSLSKIGLQGDLRLNDSKQGIRRDGSTGIKRHISLRSVY